MSRALAIILFLTYLPTLYRLSQSRLWVEEFSHAPLIILIFFWMLWQKRDVLRTPPSEGFNYLGPLLFLLGLGLYWVGVRHKTVTLEAASMPFVFTGAFYFLLGRGAREWIFPGAYLVFMVPLPVFVIDIITFPLKRVVSLCAHLVLSFAGYPIFRKGVLLTIGDYKLLVADACSGMRSIMSLLALITLYVYLQRAGWARKIAVFLSIIPIAILANIIRVISLALITYHFGEAMGQSYYHDFSGFVVFGIALASIMLVDKGAVRLLESESPGGGVSEGGSQS